MSYVERPRFVYNDGSAVDYTMSLPQRPWTYESNAMGGSDVSAAGVPAAYVIRRDSRIRMVVRFPLSEWDNVERLVKHGQGGGSFTWYPDQSGTNHAVYLDEPTLADGIRPRRDGGDQRTFELELVLRRTTEAIFTDDYDS